MDQINELVHNELKQYAQTYFNAIVERHTEGGKCTLKPGAYTAKELADRFKAECGPYAEPESEEFNGLIDITALTFHCSFPYRQIFRILSEWEAMAKAGKAKTIFEIEGAEEKTAPVVLNERTVLGTLKTKKMKLQKIAGNWWKPRKIAKNTYNVTAYYELNGVMFPGGGKTFYADSIDSDNTREWCETWNDEKMIGVMQSFIKSESNSEEYKAYYREVLQMAGVSTEEAKEEPKTPQISTESAETKEVSAEEERHEIKHISEIVENCRLHNEMGEETDEWKYYQWLASVNHGNYRTIADKALTEAWYNIFCATMRNGKGHILVMNSHGELIDTVFKQPHQPPTEPPQDTQTDRRHEIPPKPKEAARNVCAAPPDIPKDAHIISGPPGPLLIITQTINNTN